MDRRQFLSFVGLGLIASSLPVAIAACSSKNKNNQTNSNPDNNNNNNNLINLGLISKLEQEGQLLNKDQEIIVIKNPDNDQLIALSAKCDHKGCLVNWKPDQKIFECPCHEAQFAIDGKVLKKPATSDLKIYSAINQNGSIFVKI